MPMVTCPNCGRERLVVEGKRKKCRKCGTPLTSLPPKPPKPEKITVEQLAERHPQQVAEIVKAAQDEVVREQIGELNTPILLEKYPDLVEELVAAAKEEAKKNFDEDLAKINEAAAEKLKQIQAEAKQEKEEAVLKAKNGILKLSVKKFEEAKKKQELVSKPE